ARAYAVYRVPKPGGDCHTTDARNLVAVVSDPSFTAKSAGTYLVTALDRLHNESGAARVQVEDARSAGPGAREQPPGLAEQLREHLRASHHGHEVGVASPPRHHVLVQVGGDARAGDLAEVHADVEALGAAGLAQRAQRPLGELAQLDDLGRGQLVVAGDVPVGHDHQVAGVVGVEVQHRVDDLAPGDDQAVLVAHAGD